MDKLWEYWGVFVGGYSGYFNHFVNGELTPNWHSYFYWLIVISLAVFALEILVPWRKNQKVFRKDFWLDTFYMFFNFFIFWLIFYNAASDVFVQFFKDCLALIGINNLVAIEVSSWPGWVQLLTLFVFRDFVQWNVHRLLHRVPFLWEFHKVHHSVEEMGFAAHLRYHWMETVVYRFLEYLPLAMVGFGVQPFIIVYLFTLTIGHLNHSNIYLPLGPLKYVFNNPQMHIWHHAMHLPKERQYGVNFALTLSIWDYLFGTAYIPHNGRDIQLGFSKLKEFPKTFFGQFVYGFKRKQE